MKIFYLFLLPLLAGLSLSGQEDKGKKVSIPLLKTDRIIEYTWDSGTADWVIKNTIKYNYTFENGEVQTVTVSDFNTGLPVSRIIYTYSPERILKESHYQSWISGTWTNTRRDLWFHDDEGLIIEAQIQFYQGDTWVNGIRYIDYKYDNQYLQQYTYQHWVGEQWIDSFYDSWEYDQNGNLVLRLQTRVNNTPINKFIYGVNENNLRESIIYFNWVNGSWLENYRRLYEYNQCGKINAIVYQVFINGSWINSNRQVYFYSINPENLKSQLKIPVCHKDHTIYVSGNAAEAHLAHGDCIGDCIVEKQAGEKGFDLIEKIQKPPFTIYPNPAGEKITLKFDSDECTDLKRVELTDFYGILIRSFNIRDNSDLTIYRDGLLSGKYYIKLIGKEIFTSVVIFK